MITALFSAKFAYAILAVVFIIALIWLIFSKPQSRVYIWSIFVIAIAATAIYSGIKLDLYYNAQGGVYGYITSLFNKPNQVEVDSTTFTFDNIVLTQEDNSDVYSASMFTTDVIKLKNDESYAVYVNNTPCSYVNTAPDFLKAYYNYNFYSREGEVLHSDNLELYFSLDDAGISIEVLTRGGTTSVKYWNQYFHNNNFNVRVEKTERISDELATSGEIVYNFTPEQIESLNSAIKGNNIGIVKGVKTFSARADGSLTMYFLGADGAGNDALFVSRIVGYKMHYTTEQVYQLILAQNPGSTLYVNLLQTAQEYAYEHNLTIPIDREVNLSDISNAFCKLSNIFVNNKSQIKDNVLTYDIDAYGFLDNGGRFEFRFAGVKNNPTLDDESTNAGIYAAYTALLSKARA